VGFYFLCLDSQVSQKISSLSGSYVSSVFPFSIPLSLLFFFFGCKETERKILARKEINLTTTGIERTRTRTRKRKPFSFFFLCFLENQTEQLWFQD
jgi:hypothetical protein